MRRNVTSLLSRFWNTETPLFVLGLVVAATICVLAGVILWSTFQEELPGFKAAFTLNNYSEVLAYPLMPPAARNTLMLALGTVIIACFFGLPMAWLLHRTTIPFKRWFLTLTFLQILLPGFLRAMGWIMLLSPQIGLINQGLRFIIPVDKGPLSIYNIPSMALLQGLSLTPTLFFMVAGAFVAIDPSFEESAEVCGASRLQNLRRIAVPLVMPALVAGAIYIFLIAASMFEVAALLGMPNNIQVFSTLMYTAVRPQAAADLPNYGIAGVYGVLMVIPTVIALHFYQKMLRLRHRYATVTGKGYRPKLTDLGIWKWAGVGFIVIYNLMAFLLPFLAVLWTSVVRRIQLPSMAALKTINLSGYYSAILMLTENGVLTNTIELIVSVGILSVVISLVISWIVLRTRLPGRYALDSIAMLPQAIPGVAFAFSVAYMGLLLVKQMSFFYGSVAAIILADGMRRVPFASRTISGSLIQIDPELEEAVQTSGCSRMVALRRVIIPLIVPALFYSFFWSLLMSYREVTIPLFLQSPRNVVLATAIWQRWQAGDTSTAAALGVMMVVVMGSIVLVLQRFFPQVFGGGRLRG